MSQNYKDISLAVVYFWIGICVPYSLSACKDAAKAFGKKLGYEPEENSKHRKWDFASSEYKTKGCFGYLDGDGWIYEHGKKYVGSIFYGTGGLVEQANQDITPPRYRPPGYDCLYTGNSLFIDSKECG